MDELIGRYKILGLLGRGGMGSVYLGEDPQTGEKVAIKILSSDAVIQDKDLLARLKREGEALRLLNHPNIVKVLDVIEASGEYALVLEYVEGGSLWELLKRQPQLPIPAVLKIALELADALARAHHVKIIHRDIKPANLMFAKDGTVRLTDFGLARMEHGQELTQSGMMLGSAAYMSPEALNGAVPDPRMDIWAFGVVLYEMLTGTRPFEGDNIASVLTGILIKPVPDITTLRSDIPPRLALLIMQMLEKDPASRLASVRKVGAELEQIIAETHAAEPLTLPTDIKAMIAENRPAELTSPLPRRTLTLPTAAVGDISETRLAAPRRSVNRGLATLAALALILAIGVAALVLRPGDRTQSANDQPFTPLMVEPVADGQLMVLLSQTEPLAGERPQINRFIRDNLTETLGVSAELTGLALREYPQIIRSEQEAQAAAAANQAEMVIWGNYDADLIELNISLFTRHTTGLNPDILSNTGNLRVRLMDERTESLAPQVLTSATIWYVFHDMPYEAAATMVIFNDLDLPVAETVGVTVGANVHRHYADLYGDTAAAVGYLDVALQSDPDNPILYHLRGAAIDRIDGKTSEALQNVDTAQLLSNGVWSIPHLNKANILTTRQNDLAGGIDELTQALAISPEQWLYYAIRGSYQYLAGDIAAARQDLNASLEHEPRTNFPYVLLMNLAIIDGQIDEVQSLMTTSLAKFPDPTLGNRIILTAGSATDYGGYYALTLSAFSNLTLRQYDAALRDVNAALEVRPDSPELYLFQGVVACALNDLEAAETAYSTGLALNPDMTVLYLLRADVRNRLTRPIEALQDFTAAQDTSAWENFKPVVVEALAGGAGLGCESFFNTN